MQDTPISRMVKLMRNSADLTQDDLVALVGFSKRTLADYEGGGTIPPVDKFIEIAIACKITASHMACILTEHSSWEAIDFTSYAKNEELVVFQRQALAVAQEENVALTHELEGLRKEIGKLKNL